MLCYRLAKNLQATLYFVSTLLLDSHLFTEGILEQTLFDCSQPVELTMDIGLILTTETGLEVCSRGNCGVFSTWRKSSGGRDFSSCKTTHIKCKNHFHALYS